MNVLVGADYVFGEGDAICRGFESLGHKAIKWKVGTFLPKKRHDFSLIVSNKRLRSATVKKLKKKILWFPDYIDERMDAYQKYFSLFDKTFIMTTEAPPNTTPLLWGAVPEIFKPLGVEKTIDISYVANFDHEREHTVNYLYKLPRKVHLQIFGNGWERYKKFWQKKPLNWLEYSAIINLSKINFNCHKRVAANQRCFEILGCGGFMACNNAKGIDKLFEHRKHLIVYNEPEEMLEYLATYMDLPETREKIGKAGRRLVMKKHTLKKRLRKIVRAAEKL